MDADNALARLLAAPIAHRGLHACGGPGAVENSLSAAAAAIAAGYGIECDVQLSRDGEAMVFHDDDLARLTGCRGTVAACEAAALTALRLGSSEDTIPTLAGFLAAIDGRTPLVIEIKSAGTGDLRLADRVMALLAGYSGVVALESFDPDIVRHCRAAGAICPIGLVGPHERGAALDPDAVAASDFLSWSIDDLGAVAHLGIPLTTWTVRTPAQAIEAARVGAQIVFEGLHSERGA